MTYIIKFSVKNTKFKQKRFFISPKFIYAFFSFLSANVGTTMKVRNWEVTFQNPNRGFQKTGHSKN